MPDPTDNTAEPKRYSFEEISVGAIIETRNQSFVLASEWQQEREARVKAETEIGHWTGRVDHLLQHCGDCECRVCAEIVCPNGEPLHFHHDGCPACCRDEIRAEIAERTLETAKAALKEAQRERDDPLHDAKMLVKHSATLEERERKMVELLQRIAMALSETSFASIADQIERELAAILSDHAAPVGQPK